MPSYSQGQIDEIAKTSPEKITHFNIITKNFH
jgi:hypothetical protein